ncbi:TetR/AcrR family transcriptional regulator [Paracoccus benzoatiresistens]|uniref:TetR/AcrR family transcriptional regulator n=1 Tax=Paracoccus benzoatiresistens TaxID=2997341 RepID=A0ABT4JBB0_9RHOB|nr:TetR/AcrR family transcriptional regulator [Paracoccus sp. EF6]MCZ0964179.1 TetR/AcrR family transcriptional regulator [Paracoccus sp. EF6]
MNRPVVYKSAGPTATRDRLIATGLKNLLGHGYEGMGIGPVLAEAGVPKGSFYHYFASKDDFAAEIVGAYAARYEAMRQRIFENDMLSPLARLDAYFTELQSELAHTLPHGGCLYGSLAQTASSRSPAFQSALADAYAAWHASLAGQIDAAKARGEIDPAVDTQLVVTDLINLYEGVIVRVKITGKLDAFSSLRRYLAVLGSFSVGV